ncbi:MAG: hypothetical protein AAFZ01_03100 [Pseudomonadota bacterium]
MVNGHVAVDVTVAELERADVAPMLKHDIAVNPGAHKRQAFHPGYSRVDAEDQEANKRPADDDGRLVLPGRLLEIFLSQRALIVPRLRLGPPQSARQSHHHTVEQALFREMQAALRVLIAKVPEPHPEPEPGRAVTCVTLCLAGAQVLSTNGKHAATRIEIDLGDDVVAIVVFRRRDFDPLNIHVGERPEVLDLNGVSSSDQRWRGRVCWSSCFRCAQRVVGG